MQKRRWRNKKVQEKALKNAAALKPAGLIDAKDDLDINPACERKEKSLPNQKHVTRAQI